MNSRERVHLALNHHEPDRVPLDLGGTPVSGMHVSSVYLMRQALKLDPPDTPVKVIEPCQMLGEIKLDLVEALGVDVVSTPPSMTMFGFRAENYKPWTLFDGTPVLVPEGFNTDPEPNGDILLYPEGDCTAPPSGRMPKGGSYFDAIIRQPPIDDDHLDPDNNIEEFGPISESDLEFLSEEVGQLYTQTDKAIMLTLFDTGLGDIALVPAPWLRYPRGIRDVAEWYISLTKRPEYIYEVFNRQCEIALDNLARIYKAVEDQLTGVLVTGADFGMQTGPLISPTTYRELFKPFHKKFNDWIHSHTNWISFIHSCGSIRAFIPDMIDAGFDVLNPVQTSASQMDPQQLKDDFGRQIVFWGGGIDTQSTLPFASPDEVRQEVRERMHIFRSGGGFIFSAIHNIQPDIPVENLLALFEAVEEYRI